MIRKLTMIMICLGVLAFARVSNAVVLTFDDLPGTALSAEGVAPIPDNYGGFTWGPSSYYMSPADLHAYYNVAESGFANGVVSSTPDATHIAYNDSAQMFIVSGQSFLFNSVSLTAAWRTGLQIQVTGYLNGTIVNSVTLTVNTDQATQFTFDWLVDSLEFSSFGGTTTPGLVFSDFHFAIDDFAYNELPPIIISPMIDNPLTALVRSFHSRRYGKKLGVKLRVKNDSEAKTDPLRIAMYLSEDEFYDADPLIGDELLDQKNLRRGLKPSRSKNIRFRHSSTTSLSGKYLIFVVYEQDVNGEYNIEVNNGLMKILIP